MLDERTTALVERRQALRSQATKLINQLVQDDASWNKAKLCTVRNFPKKGWFINHKVSINIAGINVFTNLHVSGRGTLFMSERCWGDGEVYSHIEVDDLTDEELETLLTELSRLLREPKEL